MAHNIRFDSYTFPNLQTVNDNFADTVPRTLRLPGLSGGYDQYGVEPAPSEIGRVTIGFYLVSQTRAGMQALRDQVRALQTVGKKQLRWTPEGSTIERFCEARVNNISDSKEVRAYTDLHQQITLDFQVDDPHWYDLEMAFSGNTGSRWGERNWGSFRWGPGETFNATTTSYLWTLVSGVGGNAPTPPILSINQVGGQKIWPKIEIIHNNTVKHMVQWKGTLVTGDCLVFDCRRMSVKLNGADAYAQFVTDNPAMWARLYPGTNQLRVSSINAASVQVAVSYYNAWK